MTSRHRRLLVGVLNPVVVVAMVVLVASPAFAAKPAKGGGGRGSSTPTGIDVSYPQCPATSLPSGEAFAIVGVTGGLANDYNACLATEFAYAQGLAATSQPVAQLYVNTADPGNTVADWPYGSSYSTGDPLGAYGTAVSSSGSTPYGTCSSYADSAPCAYIYGYDMVAGVASDGDGDAGDNTDSDVDIPGDIAYFESQTGKLAHAYQWWLDVETGNSWLSGTTGQQMNVADLQGMAAALGAADSGTGVLGIGVYSTSSQWNTITGSPGAKITYGGTSFTNSLWSLPDWIPGARSLGGAESDCTLPSFTGGKVSLAQWFGHPYDGDYACP